MDKILYHELRKQIEGYIRQKGLEQAMISLHNMIGAILEDLKREREEKSEFHFEG